VLSDLVNYPLATGAVELCNRYTKASMQCTDGELEPRVRIGTGRGKEGDYGECEVYVGGGVWLGRITLG